LVPRIGYSRCDSCGKSKKAQVLNLIAYRAVTSRQGPWLVERLCPACAEWYRDAGHWTTRLLEPMERVYRGVAWGHRRLF